jgi:eukaryotic-like serine/threonine-protein kinase
VIIPAAHYGEKIISSISARSRIAHCDIKPENILLTPEGDVKILDFGVAKYLPHLENGSVTLSHSDTITKVVCGAPAYMAPESLRERLPDRRTDIFSLGVVHYELWSGQHPFRSVTTIETVNRVLNETPVSLRNIVSGIPAALEQAISKCMAKRPQDRYQDTFELLADLKKVEVARAHTN